MARYLVKMAQTVIEKAIVYVDANSIEEAEQKAIHLATVFDEKLLPVDWKFDETDGHIEAFAELAEDKADLGT